VNRTDRVLLILMGLLIVVALLAGPLLRLTLGSTMLGVGMHPGGRMPFGAGGWTGAWAALMGVGVLIRLAFWGAVIAGVVLLMRAVGRSRPRPIQPPADQDSALEILRRRYAAGEINEVQYAEMRRFLTT
jgi:putative membrane protein